MNVAGVLSFSHAHEVTLDEWNRLIAVNLTGTFLMCRESLPHLLATRGNIVNLASTASHAGQPWAVAYSATKGGVLAMTRELAVEYAEQGLRCNSVSPGAIDTPITLSFSLPEGANPKLLRRVTPLGPFGTPEGIAAAIAFIASDEASHMNGADIRMDGATLLLTRAGRAVDAARLAADASRAEGGAPVGGPPLGGQPDAGDRGPGHQLLEGALVARCGGSSTRRPA